MRNEITEQYYPEKVSIYDFFQIIDDDKGRQAFIENMKNLKIEDQFPEDWADIFCRWMELNK